MKVLIVGTDTHLDHGIWQVEMRADDSLVIVRDGEKTALAPTGRLHWIGDVPIEIWAPEL